MYKIKHNGHQRRQKKNSIRLIAFTRGQNLLQKSDPFCPLHRPYNPFNVPTTTNNQQKSLCIINSSKNYADHSSHIAKEKLRGRSNNYCAVHPTTCHRGPLDTTISGDTGGDTSRDHNHGGCCRHLC